MRCIIIEDQAPAQRILKKYIGDYQALTLVGTFPDALQAIEFLRQAEVDLIFLDIHIPQISGIDLLKMLPNAPHVILTTAFPDYALESYELAVVDYLLKPFSFQRFIQAVSKVPAPSTPVPATLTKPSKRTETMFVKSGHSYVRLRLEDIIYIKSADDYTEMHTVDQGRILSAESLQYWEQQLPQQQFRRVHKSYIVHIDFILKIAHNQVHLEQGHQVPIGRSYKDDFLQAIVKRDGDLN
ncbi:MAG: LytTR family DNA-binding domain-containing protein [Bacteroidota bacterium]